MDDTPVDLTWVPLKYWTYGNDFFPGGSPVGVEDASGTFVPGLLLELRVGYDAPQRVRSRVGRQLKALYESDAGCLAVKTRLGVGRAAEANYSYGPNAGPSFISVKVAGEEARATMEAQGWGTFGKR